MKERTKGILLGFFVVIPVTSFLWQGLVAVLTDKPFSLPFTIIQILFAWVIVSFLNLIGFIDFGD